MACRRVVPVGNRLFSFCKIVDTQPQMADPTSISGLNGISGEFPQRKGNSSAKRSLKSKALERNSVADEDREPTTIADDPNAKLIEALDRLRAPNELGPVEHELAATIRGAKYYQEESRTGLPILTEDLSDFDDLPPPSMQHLA